MHEIVPRGARRDYENYTRVQLLLHCFNHTDAKVTRIYAIEISIYCHILRNSACHCFFFSLVERCGQCMCSCGSAPYDATRRLFVNLIFLPRVPFFFFSSISKTISLHFSDSELVHLLLATTDRRAERAEPVDFERSALHTKQSGSSK